MHVRQQIREAAASALTGLTTTAARVFQSRVRPLRDADLPCLLINTDDESIESTNAVAGGEIDRTLTLSVRAVAKVSDTLDDTLDTIAEQVEPVLNNATLGGLVRGLTLERIRVEMDDALEKPAGVLTLEYRAVYFTTPGQPGTAL